MRLEGWGRYSNTLPDEAVADFAMSQMMLGWKLKGFTLTRAMEGMRLGRDDVFVD